MKKTLTLVLSLALAVAIGIGGTLAYLTSKTQTISNTFTIGSVAVSLYETDKEGNKVTNGIQYTVSAHNFRKKRAFFVKGATVATKCINKSRTILKRSSGSSLLVLA